MGSIGKSLTIRFCERHAWQRGNDVEQTHITRGAWRSEQLDEGNVVPTRILDCNPIVTVSDLRKAERFYVDVIGFSVDFDSGDVLGLVKDGVLILLISQNSENARQPPGSSNVGFLTDEVDSLYDRCVAASVEILVEPGDRPYGQRDFAVSDPDGSVLSFGSRLPSDPDRFCAQ